ncbi:MAG: right-handed parallel beta-helix repeat-containing protein, partial [Xanthomonadales bacterium]|nr:right-handed parallel beta-helix repeat-containing protein [Xanthomonadales bacterium]
MRAPKPLLRPSTLSLCLAGALGLTPPSVHAAGDDARVQARYQHRLDQRRLRLAGPIERVPAPAPTRVGAILPVTSCADDGSAGTLRSVIAAAGENDTIDMRALACGTIVLTQGEIDISVLGDHPINNLTLIGPGRDALVIDANDDRFLYHAQFQSGVAQLALRDLTIRNGRYAHGLASCIDSSGDVSLTRVTISDCHASNGGPLTFGGAVSVSGDLALVDSTITGSSSSAGGDNVAIGGGAYVTGNLSLVDSTISGNTARSIIGDDGPTYLTAGGGAYVRGELSMTRSTISGNTVEATGTGEAATGAGLFVRDTAVLVDSTIDGNIADGSGGGIAKAAFSVYGDPGTTLTLRNTTISGNAAASGAAIASARPLTLANSTVSANVASDGGAVLFAPDGTPSATFTLQSTIVAANTASAGAALPADLASTGTLTVSGAD